MSSCLDRLLVLYGAHMFCRGVAFNPQADIANAGACHSCNSRMKRLIDGIRSTVADRHVCAALPVPLTLPQAALA